jgi:excisionase family DNA binding protein
MRSAGQEATPSGAVNGWQPPKRVAADPYVASVPEAAEVLGISKDLAYDPARRGELPGAFHLGRRWRVSLIKLRNAVHGAEHNVTEHTG